MRTQRIDRDDRAAALADTILARLGDDIPLRVGITQGEADGLDWQLVIGLEPGTNSSAPLDIIDLTVVTSSNRIIGQWQTLRVAAQTPQ